MSSSVYGLCTKFLFNKKTDVPQNPRYSRPNTPAVPDLDLGLGSCARSNVASDGKAIEGEVLALEGVDDIHRCDCLPTGIFSVRRGVADQAFEERLQGGTSVLIYVARDALDATTMGDSANCRIRDALQVVSEHNSVSRHLRRPDFGLDFGRASRDAGRWGRCGRLRVLDDDHIAALQLGQLW